MACDVYTCETHKLDFYNLYKPGTDKLYSDVCLCCSANTSGCVVNGLGATAASIIAAILFVLKSDLPSYICMPNFLVCIMCNVCVSTIGLLLSLRYC